MTEIQRVFIQNLKRFRKESGFSQMKLAELCNISTSYLGELEIGRKFPSVETFQKIADALQIKPYKLIMDVNRIEELDRNDVVKTVSETIKETLLSTIDSAVAKYLIAAETEETFPDKEKRDKS